MTTEKKEASETREHHNVHVSVRPLTDDEQKDRLEKAGRLNPGGSA